MDVEILSKEISLLREQLLACDQRLDALEEHKAECLEKHEQTSQSLSNSTLQNSEIIRAELALALQEAKTAEEQAIAEQKTAEVQMLEAVAEEEVAAAEDEVAVAEQEVAAVEEIEAEPPGRSSPATTRRESELDRMIRA